MADVTFNEEPQYARRAGADVEQSGTIIGLMYKLGFAKTKKDANVVMGGIIAVCVLVSATMFVFVQPHPNAAQKAALQRDVERFQATNGAVVTPGT